MDSIKTKPIFSFLAVLAICSTCGLHLWQTLFNNFSVDVLGLDGHHVGIIQSVREIPGFLSILVVYFLLIIKEHRLSALSVLVLGLGIALTGLLPSFSGLIFTTLLMSFGFHYFETTNQSLTLQYYNKQQAPLVFGKLRSYSALSSIVISLAIFCLDPLLDFKQFYLLFGIVICVVALYFFTKDPTEPDLIPQKKEMVLKQKYWLYYTLTFLAGARRQIFIAFAVFLLVKKFDFSLQKIAILFFINNGINYFLAPFIGKCINRFGERAVLSLEYGALIVVFIAYALVDSTLVVALLYIADHIFFNFSIAIRTFFQKISDPADIAPSMAVGFTINHIAAVVLPALGGMLWLIDYRIPFLCGAFLSLLSLLFVQVIPRQLTKNTIKNEQ